MYTVRPWGHGVALAVWECGLGELGGWSMYAGDGVQSVMRALNGCMRSVHPEGMADIKGRA